MRTDPLSAPLSTQDRAILEFARKLTQTPAEMGPEDVEALRREGLDDVAIHDVTQVAAMFNYYNRLADGLGIDLEED